MSTHEKEHINNGETRGLDNLSENIENEREFKVLLSDNVTLMQRLEEFKTACEEHEKHARKRCKRRYYNLGLMARVVIETTEEEIKSLLKNGARTFLVDTVTNKPEDMEQLFTRTSNAIEEYEAEQQLNLRIATGLAIEINGDCCRVGRMRNNCSVLVHRGDIMTLTIDESYRYSCFSQISYVINLKYYIKTLSLQDTICIGKEIRGKIVKKLKDNIAVLIEDAGLLNSYEYIELPNQCYSLTTETYPDLFMRDLEIAADAKADFVVMPKIRCKPFLRTLRASLKDNFDLKLIGSIDLEYVSSRMLDMIGIIKLLDYLWIPNMFTAGTTLQTYMLHEVIPLAKCLKKPIIGSVPLERCSDFKRFENHEFLWKTDTIFIEKSPWCNKYPLIVKKLLPIRDFRRGIIDSCMEVKNTLNSYQSIVNFVIRTISSVECQAIIMHTKCETAAVALGRVEIYCPVLMMLPIDEENCEELKCKLKLAKAFNLRRNLRGVLYTEEQNEYQLKPVDYGIRYGRCCGLLETGDFIITLEVCKEDEEDVRYGLDDDVVILRAFYLPPLPTTEPYKYS